MQEPVLSGVQRMAAARVIGAAAQLSASDVEGGNAVAELQAITTDPVPLGYALGVFLHHVETESTSSNQAAVDMLRAAGADEEIAAAKLAWVRWRADKESHNWMRRKQQGAT
jgi:hypothetical protein